MEGRDVRRCVSERESVGAFSVLGGESELGEVSATGAGQILLGDFTVGGCRGGEVNNRTGNICRNSGAYYGKREGIMRKHGL